MRTDRDAVVQVHNGFLEGLQGELGIAALPCDPARATCHVPVKACGLAACVWPRGKAGEAPLRLKPDDAVIEVRDSGAGHDAKVFDAFVPEGMEPPQAAPLTKPFAGLA